MTLAPDQLLENLATEAARVALRSPSYAAQDIDPARFAALNRAQLLLLIARLPRLRADLAGRYATMLAESHQLLRQLTDADPVVAETAAVLLGSVPETLTLSLTAKAKRTPKPRVSVEERRAHRVQRDIGEVRAARDRARRQVEWVSRERDAARQELGAALMDRDEALAVIESLRVQLAIERQRSAVIATDLGNAAALLAGAIRPADSMALPLADADPRDVEPPRDEGAAASESGRAGQGGDRLTSVFDAAGISREAFLAVLDALRSPANGGPAPAVSTHPREMALTPLGGGTDIGGSCMLVEVGDVRLLVDAGMRPKQPLNRAGPPHIDMARAGHLDAIVITHAHNDHAGYVPALTADYAGLPVFCTPDTAELLPTMWADSVKVFDRTRHEYVPYGEPAAEPPYGQLQVIAALRRIRPLEFGKTVEVANGVTIELFPAGHILGAAGVVVSAGPTRITITGDVSDLAQATVPGVAVPRSARGSDLLVIESTNCQRAVHREAEVENFLATVLETVMSGGRVLVPAFALGRAQEVALTLRNRLPDVPVLIDGMAKQIAHIYEQQTAGGDRPLRIYGEQVREVAPEQRRELITAFRRGVVVTTSGMLTAGPAVQWARAILPDPNAALLLAGHQDEESPGAALLDLARGAQASFVLDGQSIDVRAKVTKFGLSAHADRRGLSSIVDEVSARQVMLVHGLPGPQREFSEYLTRLGRRMARTERWKS